MSACRECGACPCYEHERVTVYHGRGIPRMGPRHVDRLAARRARAFSHSSLDRVRWFLWLCALAGALVFAVIGFFRS